MYVSIVIPVLNEIDSLPQLTKELSNNLKAYDSWEVIFIDDGSTDGSTTWLIQYCASNENFTLIQFFRNYGKSAALSEGFKISNGE